MRATVAIVFLTVMALFGCVTTPTYTVPEYEFLAPPPANNTGINQAFESIVVINQGWGQGTGFVIAIHEEWTYVMTANHVVKKTDVANVNGVRADVYARAPGHDLAIMRLPTEGRYGFSFEFASPVIDASVWALGYSSWGNRVVRLVHQGWVVSTDFVGIRGGWVVVHNAGGRGGMSGGPLVNKAGEVVGICSFFADLGTRPNSINASELAAVPGLSAKRFWFLVKKGQHLVPELIEDVTEEKDG